MPQNSPLILSLIFLLSLACQREKEEVLEDVFEPKLVAIAVQDLERSIQWYTQKLGFEVEKEMTEYPDHGLRNAFLKLGDFHLEIIEFSKAYKPSEILPNEESYVGGVFKLGWKVNDIETVYNRIKEMEEVDMVAELGELPESSISIPWPSKYFLIQDPDGNYLQFFDSGNHPYPSPWLFMLTVENLEQVQSWYTQNLGFKLLQTQGSQGNMRAILARNGYVLELFEPAQVLKAAEIPSDSTILGFNKLAFRVDDLSTLSTSFENKKVEIALPLAPTEDIDWASQGMIVKDLEGNWTQLFEIK